MQPATLGTEQPTHGALPDNITQSERLRQRYSELKQHTPMLRARNAAETLGVSEGELVAAHVSVQNTRLRCEPETLLPEVKCLGQVMALTRNEACVHERKGVYDGFEANRHGAMRMGLFTNADIDLRLFFNHWQHAFAVTEGQPGQPRQSLQFFDKAGVAVHKIYLTDQSDKTAYDALVARFADTDQTPGMTLTVYAPAVSNKHDHEVDWSAFRKAWEALKDTHDFFPMLRKFKVDRQQAFRHIGSDFACRVGNDAARHCLQMARDLQCEIMVFVGNRGCIQIHTGPVHKLVEQGPWYNVLDPLFNLHLREDMIADTWVTKKPTVDGIVTALEVFAADGSIIATLFGKRKPGMAELPLWREIIDDLAAMETPA